MSTIQVDQIGLYDPISYRFLPPDNKRFDTVETVVFEGLAPLCRSRHVTINNGKLDEFFYI